MPDSTLDLTFLPAAKLAAFMHARQVSPVEVSDAFIRRIEAVNPRLNAFVTLTLETAREEARAAEQRIANGSPLGPLDGVPVSVKDTIATAGVRTVGGTRLRESFVPKADAPVVARLKQAGAIVLGKTNVPECAMDLRSDNPVFGRTNNPWDLARTCGGSSGGEAAALAAGLAAAGVGSDMGGSIRIPAHFCGIVGLKPTPGRVPHSGFFPAGHGPASLGTAAGPMARYVEDAALLFQVLAGFDAGDPVSVNLPARDWRAVDARNLKVMWYADDGLTPVTDATRAAVEGAARALADRGLDVFQWRPAGIERAFDLWRIVLNESGVSEIFRLYEGHEDLAGPVIRAMKKHLKPPALEAFVSAWVERDRLRASLVADMTYRPILLAPVASVPAFPHDHRGAFRVGSADVDYLRAFSYAMTFNVLALPACAVPCGRSPEGLPIGVQVVGRPWEEESVLAVAALLEEALGGYQRPPL